MFRCLCVLVFLLVSCDQKIEKNTASKNEVKSVFSVNSPLNYFVSRIAGDLVSTNVLIPGDIDPAFWEPTPEDIIKVQKNDLIVLNGANYAKWLPYVSLSKNKQVNTSVNFKESYIEIATDTHSHGPGGEHSHGLLAFTTWLDLSLAAKQAIEINLALSEKYPEHKETFETNFKALEAELLLLHKELEVLGTQLGSVAIVGSHPVYQYLAKAYKLNIKSLHWEPEMKIAEEQVAELKKILESHPSKVMMWEGEASEANVTKLKELGIKSFVFSPGAAFEDGQDFISLMKANIKSLKELTL